MKRKGFVVAVFLLASICLSSADFFPDDEEDPLNVRHERFRRFIRVMSRKPYKDAMMEKGIGWKGHLKNLFKGGTVKVEFFIPHIDKFGKGFFFKELDDVKPDKKDYEMLERENREEMDDNYGILINPRIRKGDI